MQGFHENSQRARAGTGAHARLQQRWGCFSCRSFGLRMVELVLTPIGPTESSGIAGGSTLTSITFMTRLPARYIPIWVYFMLQIATPHTGGSTHITITR